MTCTHEEDDVSLVQDAKDFHDINLNHHNAMQCEEKAHENPHWNFSTHKLPSQETCEITDGEYSCLMCDYTATSHYHFQRHVRMHAEIKKYKCPHCIYSTNSRHGLKTHVMIHTGEKPYTCPHCDYATRNSGHLKRHVRIHTKAKPYEFSGFSLPKIMPHYYINDLGKLIKINTEEESFKCDSGI